MSTRNRIVRLAPAFLLLIALVGLRSSATALPGLFGAAADTLAPVVTVLTPDGGETWQGGTLRSVTWTAVDDVLVTSVDLFYRDSETAPWTMIARSVANSGTFSWPVHNTPTASARVRVLARDSSGNVGTDASDDLFTITATPGGIVNTTLRDFHQPGSQPFSAGNFQGVSACMNCHGNYDPAAEPGFAYKGTMMAQAARDPLFYACLAIAEQDAPSSGDLCIRCHSPGAWLSGRSQPTNAAAFTAVDRDGVSCDVCHRAVDFDYRAGVSPIEDVVVLDSLVSTPTEYSNGQYIIDWANKRRGPYTDPASPHSFLASPFYRSANLCGTCHDVSNPVFSRVSGHDYAPGPLDQAAPTISAATLMPIERTFSEWKNSDFAAGVYAPEFAGVKPDGIVSSCQDCHLADVSGKGCNSPAAPVRGDLGFHDFTGGNAWMPTVIGTLYPSETDTAALGAAVARARAMLGKSAVLAIGVESAGDSLRAEITITNRTGHKLPTGYPEGRRMWLRVTARDALGSVVYASGAYDAATGVLTEDPDIALYEMKLGLSPSFAASIGLPAGPGFHFVLNDTVYKDNRIPPRGFTNAAFDAFGGAPVDAYRPAPRYADGQNWDTASYMLPPSARSVHAELLYQTASKEYIEFLRDENTTNAAGTTLYNAWAASGRSAPVTMARDSLFFGQSGVSETVTAAPPRLAPEMNPFRGALRLRLDLDRPAEVTLRIFDVMGRLVERRDFGRIGGGAHRLEWSGEGSPPGLYWAKVRIGSEEVVRKVVKVR